HRLVTFSRQRGRIHLEQQPGPATVPGQAERDGRRGSATDQCRQLPRCRDAIGRNGAVDRERDHRWRETFLIVLNEDALGLLILRDQLGAGGIPCGSHSMIAQDGEVLVTVKENGQGQRAEMNSRDLLLAGPRHRYPWWGLRSPNAVELVVIGLV